MIHYGTEDYIEAEKIILDKGEQYRFNGPFLRMRYKNDDRNVRVEAALIDLLMSYDNEGGKVRAFAQQPSEAAAMRTRLNHIRRHTDPDFLRHYLDQRREAARDSEQWAEQYSGDFPQKRGAERKREHSLFMISVIDWAVVGLDEVMQKHPRLKFLKSGEDDVDHFKNMVESAGLAIAREEGFKFELDVGALYFLGDFYWDPSEEGIHEFLPLLREDERDEVSLHIKTDLFDMAPEEQRTILAEHPNAAKVYSAYLKRLPAMVREAQLIEEKLAALAGTSNKKDRELRQSPDFEKISTLNLYADTDHLALVKHILEDRYAFMSQKRPPAPHSRTAKTATLRL